MHHDISPGSANEWVHLLIYQPNIALIGGMKIRLHVWGQNSSVLNPRELTLKAEANTNVGLKVQTDLSYCRSQVYRRQGTLALHRQVINVMIWYSS